MAGYVFRFVSAPMTYKKWIEGVLGNLLGDIYAAYVDEIVIILTRNICWNIMIRTSLDLHKSS